MPIIVHLLILKSAWQCWIHPSFHIHSWLLLAATIRMHSQAVGHTGIRPSNAESLVLFAVWKVNFLQRRRNCAGARSPSPEDFAKFKCQIKGSFSVTKKVSCPPPKTETLPTSLLFLRWLIALKMMRQPKITDHIVPKFVFRVPHAGCAEANHILVRLYLKSLSSRKPFLRKWSAPTLVTSKRWPYSWSQVTRL